MHSAKVSTVVVREGGQYRRPDQNIDWRFILPAPLTGSMERLVLLGGTEDLAKGVVEAGITSHVSRELPEEPNADILIYLHDTPVPLESAARCLRPGGVAYIEAAQRLSPLALLQNPHFHDLKSMGLTPLSTFLIRPDAKAAQSYIPLDRLNALNWYLEKLFPRTSPGKHLFSFTAKRFPSLLPAIPHFARHFAIIAVAGEQLPDSSLLLDGLSIKDLNIDDSHSPLVLRSTDGGANRSVCFLFPPGISEPSVVLKMVRSSNENKRNEHEQKVLSEIRSLLTPELRQTLPMPIGEGQWQSFSVSAESCVRGQPLSMMTRHWWAGLREHISSLELATNWLIEFHRQATISTKQWDEQAVQHWVESCLSEYSKAFDVTPAEQQLFEMTTKRGRELLGTPIPLVWTHGDFKERNLLFDGEIVSVIDWELSTPGLPLIDLIYFSTLWNHSARSLEDHPSILQSFRTLIGIPEPNDAVTQAVLSNYDRYLQALNIDPRFFPVLLVNLWVEHALRRYKRQRAVGEPDAEIRSNNPYAGYVEALADEAPQLFGRYSDD